MANRFLSFLYERLYKEKFSYSEFSKRLKMQKGIYLLQEMGVPVGDYRFSWYKHGPYSQSLLDDMHHESSEGLVLLAADAETAVDELSKVLEVPQGSKYSCEDWSECLGSLHYLKKNVFSRLSDDAALLDELEKRKTHLNEKKSNEFALSCIEKLFF